LQYVAVCCSLLQCAAVLQIGTEVIVAVCCSVLQCVTKILDGAGNGESMRKMVIFAVCCSPLQSVAVCCSVSEWDKGNCCSVLQCVPVCCSVLPRILDGAGN